KRILKTDDAACRACGEADETVRHVMLECDVFAGARNKFLGEVLADRDGLPGLFHTKKGMSAVLEFVKETGFGTCKGFKEKFLAAAGSDEEDE
ncbi:hypothetical protein SEPCBS57363_006832, partial [Sporothrix epigloea]